MAGGGGGGGGHTEFVDRRLEEALRVKTWRKVGFGETYRLFGFRMGQTRGFQEQNAGMNVHLGRGQWVE